MLRLKEICRGHQKCKAQHKNQLIYGISVDMKEESAHQQQFVSDETSRFYHFLSSKWKLCHKVIKSRSPDPRILPERYFRSH